MFVFPIQLINVLTLGKPLLSVSNIAGTLLKFLLNSHKAIVCCFATLTTLSILNNKYGGIGPRKNLQIQIQKRIFYEEKWLKVTAGDPTFFVLFDILKWIFR